MSIHAFFSLELSTLESDVKLALLDEPRITQIPFLLWIGQGYL